MKRIVSGITPSGNASLHIANYLGAVKQFIEMARTNECFLFVADLHALTTVQNKKQLECNVETVVLDELALLQAFLTKEEFDRLTFFRQSDVPEHTELSVILSNYTPYGLIKRAHAYKDKLQKDTTEDDINMGLFCYPILMAADILLYKPDLVPVGKDQKQHVEITRDIAQRFNKTHKTKIFKLPEPYIPENVATVLGTDGKRKMSKSLGNIISIFEDEDVIKKQVMGCYTDPTRAHTTDPGHIEGNMVFTYLDFFGDPKRTEELKMLYTQGKVADVEVKQYLFERLISYFTPARKRYQELKNNPEKVKRILKDGAERASHIAQLTMKEVRSRIGITSSLSTVKTKNIVSSDEYITIEDFGRVELRVGYVEQAQNVEKSEKLIRLHVDVGEPKKRTIFTGVRGYGYTSDDFSGKQFFFVTNLMPRTMMGEESQGMILAVDGADGKPLFVSAEGLPVGSSIR